MATIEERFGMIERSVLEQAGAEAQKLLDQAWEYKFLSQIRSCQERCSLTQTQGNLLQLA